MNRVVLWLVGLFAVTSNPGCLRHSTVQSEMGEEICTASSGLQFVQVMTGKRMVYWSRTELTRGQLAAVQPDIVDEIDQYVEGMYSGPDGAPLVAGVHPERPKDASVPMTGITPSQVPSIVAALSTFDTMTPDAYRIPQPDEWRRAAAVVGGAVSDARTVCDLSNVDDAGSRGPIEVFPTLAPPYGRADCDDGFVYLAETDQEDVVVFSWLGNASEWAARGGRWWYCGGNYHSNLAHLRCLVAAEVGTPTIGLRLIAVDTSNLRCTARSSSQGF